MISKPQQPSQSGQTLIETIVAVFMLVTAMLATLGALQYLLKSSDLVIKQTIAQGLASEGIDVVKNIRDSNWLQGPINSDCAELKLNPGDPAQPCYRQWLNGLSFGDYIPYLKASNYTWQMDKDTGFSHILQYGSRNSNGVSFYVNSTPGACASLSPCTPTIFYRKVSLTDASFAGVPAQDPIVKITSTVWWVSGNCPVTEDPNTLRAACKVVVTDYITNWKNY